MGDAIDTIRFSVDPARHGDLVTGTIVAKLVDREVAMAITVPAGPTTTEALLPILHEMANLFAARGESRVRNWGRDVSCRAGCAACCRQLIPLPRAEARFVADLVDAMPDPRRTAVRARFAEAKAAAERAGLGGQLSDPMYNGEADIGVRYFRLGIPCPFLEQEACSIYADRPLICREYMVTSPPENCDDPRADRIEDVPIEWRLMLALFHAEQDQGWVPLTFALDEARPAPAKLRTGPDILRAIVATAMRPGQVAPLPRGA